MCGVFHRNRGSGFLMMCVCFCSKARCLGKRLARAGTKDVRPGASRGANPRRGEITVFLPWWVSSQDADALPPAGTDSAFSWCDPGPGAQNN